MASFARLQARGSAILSTTSSARGGSRRTVGDPAPSPLASWLFAGSGTEPRKRRPADGVLLLAGSAGLLLASLVASATSPSDADVGQSLVTLLGWLEPVWRVAGAAVVAIAVGLVVVALVRRRPGLAADVVAAVVLSGVGGFLLSRLVDGSWPEAADAVRLPGAPAYPVVYVAGGVASVVVAAPALTRPARRLAGSVVVLAAIGAAALGQALPSGVLGGVALGLVAAAAVRLVRGSSAGFPDAGRVASDLSELGVTATDLRPATDQRRGVAAYRATVGGSDVDVRVHGRDARDAQYLATAWRRLWYRDGGPLLSSTRREQVEHEALLLVLAAELGVPVARVVAVGTAPATGDAVLVTTRPEGRRLDEVASHGLPPGALAQLWAAVTRLHAGGIAHGQLDARAVRVSGDEVVIGELGVGRSSAPAAARDIDVADLLVSSAMAVGPDAAMSAAVDAVGRDALAAATPYLQRAALTPWHRDAARRAHVDLEDLRRRAAAASGVEAEPLAQLRRVRLRDVVLTALTLVAACTLLSNLADVGLASIADQLADAQWAWVLTAVVVAQLALVGEAVGMTGAVPGDVPLGPTVLLQSAIKFVNLTVPSAAGKLAVTLRFLQRQGLPGGAAISQGALDSLAGFAIQALVLALVLPGVDLDLQLERSGGGDLGPLALVLGVAAVVVLLVVTLLPPVRRRIGPVVGAAVDNVTGLAHSPRRVARLVGGNAWAQVAYALCLGASLAAYGTSLPFGDLLFANVAVTLFAGLMPVPGGIGVAEAALTTVLVALGVDHEIALTAAVTHRLASYYLPPIWGYVALRWLGSHGFV